MCRTETMLLNTKSHFVLLKTQYKQPRRQIYEKLI